MDRSKTKATYSLLPSPPGGKSRKQFSVSYVKSPWISHVGEKAREKRRNRKNAPWGPYLHLSVPELLPGYTKSRYHILGFSPSGVGFQDIFHLNKELRTKHKWWQCWFVKVKVKVKGEGEAGRVNLGWIKEGEKKSKEKYTLGDAECAIKMKAPLVSSSPNLCPFVPSALCGN